MSLTINMQKLTNPLHDKHLLIFISKFLITCDKCNKTFRLRNDLFLHLQGEHGIFFPYPCPHCDKKFLRNGILQTHVKTVHEKI